MKARQPNFTRLHGHVMARPDGKRMSCGGVVLCPHCQGERAALDAIGPGFEANVQRVRELSTALVFSRRWAKWWKVAARVGRYADCPRYGSVYLEADEPPAHYDDCAILRGKGDCNCKGATR